MKKYLTFLIFIFCIPSIFAKPIALIFMGACGCGKGTQAALLQNKFGFVHISTGDLLRDHIKNKTSLGLQIKKQLDEGFLIPDEIILNILFDEVMKNYELNNNIIIDGSSRTVNQANFLYNSFFEKFELFAFFFDVDYETLLDRITNRLYCPICNLTYNQKFLPSKNELSCDICKNELKKRSDDNENIFGKRYALYNEHFLSLKKFYENKENVYFLDANCSILFLHQQIINILENKQ